MSELENLLRANILVEPYNDETDYNILTSVVEDYCNQFSLRFLSFLRENYSAGNKYGDYFIDNNDWREFNSDKIHTTEEILNKFLKKDE